jgi:hypothetical protein
MTDAELMTAAYDYVEGMVPRADIPGRFPAWYGWALNRAFRDGAATANAERDRLAARVAELEAALGELLNWSHCIRTVEPEDLEQTLARVRAAIARPPA